MHLTKHKILITGGGSGIGLAIAKAFNGLGNKVIVCGRDETKLREATMKVHGIEYIVCDVTNHSDIDSLAHYMKDRVGGITILVNNAGIAHFYDVNDGKMYEFARREMETNYFGLIDLTEAMLPILKRQPESAIVNVSSATAYVPSQWLPTYSASKAAVHSFSTSLRYSLQGSSVKVFDVLPPLVDTDFAKGQNTNKKIFPETVAKALVNGMKNDTYEIRVASVKALYNVQRFAPSIAHRIMNNIIRL